MGVGEERRFASGVKVEEGGAADPYVGALGFDPGRVEFEPVDVESGYFVRRRREGRGKGVLGTVMVVADRTSGRLI